MCRITEGEWYGFWTVSLVDALKIISGANINQNDKEVEHKKLILHLGWKVQVTWTWLQFICVLHFEYIQ